MAWPTTSNRRTVFVTVRLTQDEADGLDALAQAQGLTRSKVVRAAVTDLVKKASRAQRRSTSQGA